MSPRTETAPLRRGLPPRHPGEHLKELLPELKRLGVPATDVALRLGVGHRTLYDLRAGRTSVTPDMALRLGKLFGTSAEMWMNLQTAYDLWQARERLGGALEAIETLPREGVAA